MNNLEGFKKFLADDEAVKPRMMDAEIVNLYLHQPSVKVAELAGQAGISVAELYRILNRYNSKPYRQGKRRETVRSYSEEGHSVRDIANMTGYTPRNVRYILSKYKRNQLGE